MAFYSCYNNNNYNLVIIVIAKYQMNSSILYWTEIVQFRLFLTNMHASSAH